MDIRCTYAVLGEALDLYLSIVEREVSLWQHPNDRRQEEEDQARIGVASSHCLSATPQPRRTREQNFCLSTDPQQGKI
jgi:hypothetical protein